MMLCFAALSVLAGEKRDSPPMWTYAGLPRKEEWDMIIDVRSPSEYALDSIPGAVNLPVLSDDERAIVGTSYKESGFEGRRLGARFVAVNLVGIIDAVDLPKDSRILVYCWRGGQRSGSVARVLADIGWHVARLDQGYKGYRARVRHFLYESFPVKFHRLDGPTGSGKGAVLEQISCSVDLEQLANHRGSALGDNFEEDGSVSSQPSQKTFETRLFWALLDRECAIVEAESAKIGRLQVPNGVCAEIANPTLGATRIEVPIEARIRRIREMYKIFENERIDLLRTKLKERLRAPRKWLDLVDEGDFDTLVRTLLTEHYDPQYSRARKRDALTHQGGSTVEKVLALPDLDPETIGLAAIELQKDLSL